MQLEKIWIDLPLTAFQEFEEALFASLRNVTQVGEKSVIPSRRQFATISFPGASSYVFPL
jgi:hypothetical protein